jgi:hypothetical protein
MAIATLTFSQPDRQTITKKFGAPKKMTMEAWYKAARKVIPEIPNVKDTDWQILSEEATKDARWIIYDLANSVGDRAKVLIDRTVPLIG